MAQNALWARDPAISDERWFVQHQRRKETGALGWRGLGKHTHI